MNYHEAKRIDRCEEITLPWATVPTSTRGNVSTFSAKSATSASWGYRSRGFGMAMSIMPKQYAATSYSPNTKWRPSSTR